MLPLTFILCFLAYGFSYGQQTILLGVLLQEEVPLLIQLREFPEAKKNSINTALKSLVVLLLAPLGCYY